MGDCDITLRLNISTEYLYSHPSMPLNVKSATATRPVQCRRCRRRTSDRRVADRAAAPCSPCPLTPSPSVARAHAHALVKMPPPLHSDLHPRASRRRRPPPARPPGPRTLRRHLGNCPSESVSRRSLPAAASAHYSTPLPLPKWKRDRW